MMKKQTDKIRYQKCKSAFTLIECLLAAVILMIVFAAIMTFRYYTVGSAERAENQLLAARCAYLLSEAWKGGKAEPSFDPVQHHFDETFQIETLASPDILMMDPAGSESQQLHQYSGLTILGNYQIRVDNKEFSTQLLYQDLPGVQNLRSIHILVVWQDSRGVRYEYYLPTLSRT